jgi:hypothetical protein
MQQSNIYLGIYILDYYLFWKIRVLHKGNLLLKLEVPFIFYMLDMDVSRPTCSLREMSILHSIQELTMARTDNHEGLMCSITNPSIERTS